jgi:hypothetical protein
MIKNFSIALTISALIGCNSVGIINSEPDQHYYRVGKTHRNVGPYIWNSKSYVDDPNGNRTIGYVYSTDDRLDSTTVTRQVVEISRYVTDSLKELGQDNCPIESLINVYFVPKDTINDPEKMVFITEQAMTNHKTLFGLTTSAFPFPITASYICSDCEEYDQETLIVHELTHAWLLLCGDSDLALTEDVPEMLESEYSLR